VNLKTGKPSLRTGYAPATINHALTVVHGFYSFHGRFGDGPVMNPVPVSAQRRQMLAHRSPLEPVPFVRRARLRQKVPRQAPRAIPDALWDELFAAMGCDRDRALLEFYVSSGARASELLGLALEDVDWAASSSTSCPTAPGSASRCRRRRTRSVTWAATWPRTGSHPRASPSGGLAGVSPGR
jgi:integrase